MKVYIVEFGEYSDRNVSGVYSTKERAKIAARSDGDITEYEVDEAFDLYDKGLRPFSVTVSYTGNILRIVNDGYSTNAETRCRVSTDSYTVWPLPQAPIWNHLDVSTWARDQNHAAKIASEHHAEAVAAGWDGVHYFQVKT